MSNPIEVLIYKDRQGHYAARISQSRRKTHYVRTDSDNVEHVVRWLADHIATGTDVVSSSTTESLSILMSRYHVKRLEMDGGTWVATAHVPYPAGFTACVRIVRGRGNTPTQAVQAVGVAEGEV